MRNDIKAYRYAKWCIRKNNNKAPCYVKKQARAWLDILTGKNREAYFDKRRLKRYMAFWS